jgi:hypothetical protein
MRHVTKVRHVTLRGARPDAPARAFNPVTLHRHLETIPIHRDHRPAHIHVLTDPTRSQDLGAG